MILNCSYECEKKIHTGAAYFDITQAFDRVWHDNCTLLYNLKSLNTHSAIYNIIKFFLSDRFFQFVLMTPTQK